MYFDYESKKNPRDIENCKSRNLDWESLDWEFYEGEG